MYPAPASSHASWRWREDASAHAWTPPGKSMIKRRGAQFTKMAAEVKQPQADSSVLSNPDKTDMALYTNWGSRPARRLPALDKG